MPSPVPHLSSRSPGFPGHWEALDIIPPMILAGLAVFFTLTSRNFLQPATLVAILQESAVLAIIGAGLTLVIISAEIDLAVGMIALGAGASCGWLFESWIFYRDAPLLGMRATLVAVIAIPLLVSLLAGLVSGLVIVGSRLPGFIITLAVMFIAQGAAMWLTRGRAFRIPPFLKTLSSDGLRIGSLPVIPYSVVLAGLVLLIGHLLLRYTRFGRSIYTAGENREAAQAAGVRTGRVVVICLMISAFAAGLGGLVNVGQIRPVILDQNQDLLLGAVASVVLGGTSLFGGKGSMAKTLVGVLIFTLLNLGLNESRWIHAAGRPMLNGVVLLGALLLNGLLSNKRGS